MAWEKNDLERAARLFHALADPTRVCLARQLRHGERCVCDLTDAMDASQSRLSFHLKVMKDAGLVADRREGRWVYYALRPAALDGIAELLGAVEPHKPSARRRGCCA